MKAQILFYIFFLSLTGNSQLVESFADGDFSANPTWNGTTSDFIVNPALELQTNTAAAATSYLYVPHGLSTIAGMEWRFRVKQTFSPSSANFGRVYLTANANDPTTNPDGFYIQLGEAGSVDAVKLFEQVSGISFLICEGTAGSIASSFHYGIKITRDNAGLWTLATDATGGTNYVFDASGSGVSSAAGTYFIWQCTYTASNASKFYIDDIYVGDIVVDMAAPVVVSAAAINQNLIDVLFNEPVNQTVAEDINNYDIQPFSSATSAILDPLDPKLVHLTPSFPLTNGSQYTLFVNYMEDVLGNDTSNQTATFTYFVPENPAEGDVIINEVFADPTPSVGLPELEFVEVYNRSDKYFDLSHWKLGDASGDGTVLAGTLAPGEYKVLCATASLPSFPGASGVSSFPSLNNAADDVVLKDSAGNMLDKISYTDAWYQDEVKKVGGYTLERINPTLICSSQQNWIASSHASGGTPGVQNSVFDSTPDTDAPSVTTVFALAPNVLTLQFSEPMDALSLQMATFATVPFLTETNRIVNGTQPQEISFLLSPDFVPSQTYLFTLENTADCAGNEASFNGEFILPDLPAEGEVVINEILFDPVTGGSDFVEIYNASSKVFDVFGWFLANIAGDSVANKKQIKTHRILHPGEYIVFSKDINHLIAQYPVTLSTQLVVAELPAYNNDSGTVILMTEFDLLDRVSYNADWHFKLLDSKDGKALERINALDESNNASNWHTAAEAVGFATPGKENSQFVPSVDAGELTLPTKVFSPDNDGHEDVLQIRYKMKANELLANVQIFDAQGRLVRKLKENEYLGTEGVFAWDGVNDEGTKASIGQYVIVFEAFAPQGGIRFSDRKVCILAGKL